MKFRYDINALRAIAVIGVLLFHFKVPYFDGGFSGVDIFFVISGYLMSRIIINGIDKKSFSFIDFYSRRVNRIVPALLALIVVLTVACFFFYFPDDYHINERNATGSLAFLSNILYWKNSNYFDPAAETNILLHTWSLSVEWQFYMLYPVILLGLNKLFKSRRSLFVFFTVLNVILFFASAYYTRIDSTASFYLLPTRAWEMMFGGIAFLSEGFSKDFKYKKVTAIIGYLTLLACFLHLNTMMKWPGKYTLVPVVATFLIIISNYNDFKLLRNGVVQFIGKISYSLYLWHWPLYVIAIYLGFKIDWQTTAILLLLGVSLAYLSHKYIEQVNLKTKWILLACVLIAGSTVSLTYFNVNQFVFRPEALQMASYKARHENDIKKQFNTGSCFIAGNEDCLKLYNKGICLNLVPGKKNILLIGDSHAAQFAQSMLGRLNNTGVNISQVTASRCSPILNPKGAQGCIDFINYIYHDFIKANYKDIDGIIICSNWIERTDDNFDGLVNNLNQTISYLEGLHIKVAVIGQNEVYSIPYPLIRSKELQYHMQLQSKYLSATARQLNAHLKQRLGKHYIDVYEVNHPDFPSNTPYLFDENHLSKKGADVVTSVILRDPAYKNLLSN
jgi:peptidoglycan/LPS O-acetylase OafA/YrhL